MANFGDFKGSFDKMIALLKQIERHTRCEACGDPGGGFTTFTTTPNFSSECNMEAWLTMNGIIIGVPVNSTFDNLQQLADALNQNYSGLAMFTVFGETQIRFVINGGGNVVLNTQINC